MLPPEDAVLLGRILDAVSEGLNNIALNPQLNTHETSLLGGASITGLSSRFGITSPIVDALRLKVAADQATAEVVMPNLADMRDATAYRLLADRMDFGEAPSAEVMLERINIRMNLAKNKALLAVQDKMSEEEARALVELYQEAFPAIVPVVAG